MQQIIRVIAYHLAVLGFKLRRNIHALLNIK